MSLWVCLRHRSPLIKVRISKFGPKMHLSTVEVSMVFGIDWAWSSVSFLISDLLFSTKLCVSYSIASFCIYLVRLSPVSVPHPTWLCTYADYYARGQGSHGPWNSLLLYLGETIGVQPASTRWLALDFTSFCRFSPYNICFTCRNFICQHSSITETTEKQHPLAFILFDFQYWISVSLFTSALFLMRQTPTSHHTG